jgi:hypothetical protein
MQPQYFENAARQVVEHVLAGGRNEDSTFEIKAGWVPATEAARRVAGHANAAGGHEIIWIFGLDEDSHRLVALDATDPANWFAALRSEFERGHAPRPVQHRTIHFDQGAVHACQFDTDDCPYVIKNPQHGKVAGHAISLEVPWRDGTRVRTAGRADLLKLLLPVQQIPALDVIRACLSLNTRSRPTKASLNLEVFLYPREGARLSIPMHRCSATLEYGAVDDQRSYRFEETLFSNTGGDGMVHSVFRGLIIEGPGSIYLTVHSDFTDSVDAIPDDLTYRVVLPTAEAEFRPAIVAGTLSIAKRDVEAKSTWHDIAAPHRFDF